MGGENGGASKTNLDEDPMWGNGGILELWVSSKVNLACSAMFGGIETVSVQAAVEFMFGDGQQYIASLEKEEAKSREQMHPQEGNSLLWKIPMFGVDPSLAKLAAKNSSDVESALDWISANPDMKMRRSYSLLHK